MCVILGKVKLIKGTKPLIHHKFYLDIEKHIIATRIENKIKELGGVSIYDFVIRSVTICCPKNVKTRFMFENSTISKVF